MADQRLAVNLWNKFSFLNEIMVNIWHLQLNGIYAIGLGKMFVDGPYAGIYSKPNLVLDYIRHIHVSIFATFDHTVSKKIDIK